ncbi:TPA: hypothetical protein ACGTRQ_003812 [Vibrio parahaemolyticus]
MNAKGIEADFYQCRGIKSFNGQDVTLFVHYEVFTRTFTLLLVDENNVAHTVDTIPGNIIDDVMFVENTDELQIYYRVESTNFVIMTLDSTFSIVARHYQSFNSTPATYTRCALSDGYYLLCGVSGLVEPSVFIDTHAQSDLALAQSILIDSAVPSSDYQASDNNQNVSLFLQEDRTFWLQFKNDSGNIISNQIVVSDSGDVVVHERIFSIEHDAIGFMMGAYDADYSRVVTAFSQDKGDVFLHQQPVFSESKAGMAAREESLVKVNVTSGEYSRPYLAMNANKFFLGWQEEERITTNSVSRASFVTLSEEHFVQEDNPGQVVFTVDGIGQLYGSFVTHSTNDDLFGRDYLVNQHLSSITE